MLCCVLITIKLSVVQLFGLHSLELALAFCIILNEASISNEAKLPQLMDIMVFAPILLNSSKQLMSKMMMMMQTHPNCSVNETYFQDLFIKYKQESVWCNDTACAKHGKIYLRYERTN